MGGMTEKEEGTPLLMLKGGQVLVVLGVTYLSIMISIIFAIHYSPTDGPQVVTIHMDAKGFRPQVIEVKAGRPVELRFLREDSGPCTSGVVLDEWNIQRDLVSGGVTSIVVDPASPGKYPFHCRMGCLKGVISVRG